MKTSQVYWQNLSNKVILCLACVFFSGQVFCEIETPESGFLKDLDRLISDDKNEIRYIENGLAEKLNKRVDLINFKEMSITKSQIFSLLLYTDPQFLETLRYDECNIYSLLLNDLLRWTKGHVLNLYTDVTYNDGEKKIVSLRNKTFLNEVFKKKCSKINDYSEIFSPDNILKTLNRLEFRKPTQENCSRLVEEWKRNPYFSSLCRVGDLFRNRKTYEYIYKNTSPLKDPELRRHIGSKLSEEKLYRSNIDFYRRNYIENLCTYSSDPEKFCAPFLKENIWERVISGEFPSHYLDNTCATVLKKKPLTEAERKNCAQIIINKPELCSLRGLKYNRVLFPRSDCDNVSKALISSRLRFDYSDCSGIISNHAITNTYRIVKHFHPELYNSESATCHDSMNEVFLLTSYKDENDPKWPMKICYQNKILNKKECLNFVPGRSDSDRLSEQRVVASALSILKSAPESLTCTIVAKDQYNPRRLKYAQGCFILFNRQNCTAASCPKEVYYRDKHVKDLTYDGMARFDYFPNTYKTNLDSISSKLEEKYKIKSKKILNFSLLKFFFDMHKDGIVHGLGCAEDIHPRKFSRDLFNQCTPIPFIVDGLSEKNDIKYLTTRSSLDDVYSPRSIRWNIIFTSVRNYQEFHPLGSWNLYGLYK